MTYRQLSPEERYMLAALRRQGLTSLRSHAHSAATARRSAANSGATAPAPTAATAPSPPRSAPTAAAPAPPQRQFTAEDFALVEGLLCRQWSPEQVAGHLARTGRLSISHETIYRHVWRDKKEGGTLHTHLRGARKRRRKRYGAYDSRGRLAGKRMISERPAEVETREAVGHWEADTVMGAGSKDCIVTLVERKTGLVLVGKLADRTAGSLSRRVIRLIRRGGQVRDGDGRQRDRVPRLRAHRAADGRDVLLRAAVPLVGERQQRERQRTDADPDRLVPLDDALAFLPAVELDADAARRAAHGVAIDGSSEGAVRLRDEAGLIAIAEPRPGGLLKPTVGFRG